MFHKKKIIAALLLAGSQLLQSAEPEPVLVPTPRAKALATTAASRPFLAAARSQQVVDLAARGYAEKEVAVRGQAGADQPYVTRVLVRRPLSVDKFSGRVIVELLDNPSLYETAPLWGFSWEHFVRRGDAWVGVTVSPDAVATLRKFNPTRYAALNLAANPIDVCGRSQEGFAAGVLAQVGVMLRSASKENPLVDLNPQRLVLAGYSGSGDYVTAFAIAQHRSMRLGGDAPIFDGYMNVSGTANDPASRCAGDAIPRGVPYVAVMTSADTARTSGIVNGDQGSAGYRVHQVAGVEGAGPLAAGAPVAADLTAAGFATVKARCREPIMDLMMSHVLNAVWQQFDDLLVRQLPMESLSQLAIVVDGGSTGGWRLPQVDLPLAQSACNAAAGATPRFDVATLKRLYRSRAEYLRRFNAAVDEAVMKRLLVKEDGDSLKATASRTAPTF
jgi:hypothetical protein